MKTYHQLTLWVVSVLLVFIGGFCQATPILVETGWLKKHLDSNIVVVVDMSGDPLQYQRFHIPGAIRIDYDHLIQTRKKDHVKIRLQDHELIRRLGLWGITREHHVVIYDDLGGLYAGRLFWELERIGHPKMSVLDGGLVDWIQSGNPVENKPVKRVAERYDLSDSAGKRENEVYLDEILPKIKLPQDNQWVFLDVRSQEEFVGNPKQKRSGHIPGAKWLPWDETIDLANRFKLRSGSELQMRLSKLGIQHRDQPVVLYCRTGHRASQVYLVMRSLGFNDLRLYDGSMAEYARENTAPLVKGKN